ATVEVHFDQVEERTGGLLKVADLSRPVVHLKIDVGGVLTVPWRSHAVVPDALQVRRHGAGPAAPHQQIPAELEIKCGKAGIVLACFDPSQALIDGERFYRGI